MTDSGPILTKPAITGRGSSLNPFVIVDDAAGFISFAVDVFGAREVSEARTDTPAGLLIHAELELGDSLLLLSDPQPGWTPRPFYGAVTLARVQDRWGNLWWLYQPSPGQPDPLPAWEGGSDVVFRTLDEHLQSYGR